MYVENIIVWFLRVCVYLKIYIRYVREGVEVEERREEGWV